MKSAPVDDGLRTMHGSVSAPYMAGCIGAALPLPALILPSPVPGPCFIASHHLPSMQLELAFGVTCWSVQAGKAGWGCAVMEDFLPQTLTNGTCASGLPLPPLPTTLSSQECLLFCPICAPVLRAELQALGTGGLEGFVGVDTGRKAQARAFAGFAVGPHLSGRK